MSTPQKPVWKSNKWWNTKLSQVAVPVYTYLMLKYPSRAPELTLMAAIFGICTGIAVVAEAHIDAAAANAQQAPITAIAAPGGDATVQTETPAASGVNATGVTEPLAETKAGIPLG